MHGTTVGTDSERTEGCSLFERLPVKTFFDKLGQHGDERRMGLRAGRRHPDELDPDLRCRCGSFDIKVPQHFDVVTDEADGNDDDLTYVVVGQRSKLVVDVRFEPWNGGRPRAALPCKVPDERIT